MQTPNKITFFTLLLMISFPVANAVLITPALPAITTFFNTTPAVTQQIVTWYLVAYAVGQLLYGPLANRFGRKITLYLGIGLQIISSLICVLAGLLHILSLLAIGRFILALGAGVGLKMAFTLVNEYYPAETVNQKITYLMLSFAITPGLAIALGGILTNQFNWISCSYASAIYGVILLLLTTRLIETKKQLDLDALKLKHLLQVYKDQFNNIKLFGGGLMMGLTTCFIYIFTTIAPFVAINLLGMNSEQYGIASILPSVGYVIFTLATAKLATRYSLSTLIRAGIYLTITGVLWMFLTISLNFPALISLFIPITLIYFGEVLIYPNTSALAMQTVTDKAHAAAVMSFLTIALPTLGVLSMSLFTINTFLLPLVFSALCVGIVVIYKWITAD